MKEELDWNKHYLFLGLKPSSEQILLDVLDKEKRSNLLMVDLGCGSGRDSLTMLRHGHRVLAIDSYPAAEYWISHARTSKSDHITFKCTSFEEMTLPFCSLISSFYSLNYCKRVYFEEVFNKIVSALEDGGRFVGTLHGDRHTWHLNHPKGFTGGTYLMRSEIDELLSKFSSVEFFEELEEDKLSVSQTPTNYHYYKIVAKK